MLFAMIDERSLPQAVAKLEIGCGLTLEKVTEFHYRLRLVACPSEESSSAEESSDSVSESASESESSVAPGWYCILIRRYDTPDCSGEYTEEYVVVHSDELDWGTEWACIEDGFASYDWSRVSGPYSTEGEAVSQCEPSSDSSSEDSSSGAESSGASSGGSSSGGGSSVASSETAEYYCVLRSHYLPMSGCVGRVLYTERLVVNHPILSCENHGSDVLDTVLAGPFSTEGEAVLACAEFSESSSEESSSVELAWFCVRSYGYYTEGCAGAPSAGPWDACVRLPRYDPESWLRACELSEGAEWTYVDDTVMGGPYDTLEECLAFCGNSSSDTSSEESSAEASSDESSSDSSSTFVPDPDTWYCVEIKRFRNCCDTTKRKQISFTVSGGTGDCAQHNGSYGPYLLSAADGYGVCRAIDGTTEIAVGPTGGSIDLGAGTANKCTILLDGCAGNVTGVSGETGCCDDLEATVSISDADTSLCDGTPFQTEYECHKGDETWWNDKTLGCGGKASYWTGTYWEIYGLTLMGEYDNEYDCLSMCDAIPDVPGACYACYEGELMYCMDTYDTQCMDTFVPDTTCAELGNPCA
jgi:hypothetical protein